MWQPRIWNYQEGWQRRRRARVLGWLALGALLVLTVGLTRFLLASGTSRVILAAGKSESTVHCFLLSLAEDAARHHLDIEPTIATGTIDMLEQVNSGAADFAIIHGGFGMEQYHNIRQVGAISVAPIHLLVKKEYHATVSDDLRNLRGRTINLGNGKHTVMYWLSQELLSFLGLAAEDYRPLVVTTEQLASETELARLPDAIFISVMPPSELVRRLVVKFGYRLVAMPFGDAFRLTALRNAALPISTDEIRRENVVDARIPAFAYAASPAVPPNDVVTLGLRVLLITNSKTDNATVAKVLDLMIASRFAEAMQPTLDAGIVRQRAEVPWHPGAIEYRRRDEPIITGERLGVLSSALQILVPAGGTILLIWGWLRNRVLVRRELRFDRFIALVSGVERRVLELEQHADRDLHAIGQLHRELSTIKDAALERIAAGEAGDSSLVMSLFSHIEDVRGLLAHLERTSQRPAQMSRDG